MARLWSWTTALLVATALMVTGCTAPSPPSPSPSDSAAARRAACSQAVAGVVDAVRAMVQPYQASDTTSAATKPSAAATPSAPGTGADAALEAALAQARQTVRVNRCDPQAFTADVAAALSRVEAHGPIATAVLRRLTASITGTIGDPSVIRHADPGDDVAAIAAEVGPGGTLMLAAGTYPLAETLVLLDAIRLEGDGRTRTVLRSSAPNASILVLSADRVTLADLTLARRTKVAGSGIVAGAAALLVLDGVRVSGGRISKSRQGGAGVHVTAQQGEAAARGTTLEVSHSEFIDNGWAGVALTGAHRLSMIDSTVRGNAECGICFLDDSGGSVTTSRFIGNGVGVAAIGASRPVVLDNTFTGGEVAVQAGDRARPQLKGNSIAGATRAGVILSGKSGGTIETTTCRSVKFGIVIGRQAAPTLVGNRCAIARGG